MLWDCAQPGFVGGATGCLPPRRRSVPSWALVSGVPARHCSKLWLHRCKSPVVCCIGVSYNQAGGGGHQDVMVCHMLLRASEMLSQTLPKPQQSPQQQLHKSPQHIALSESGVEWLCAAALPVHICVYICIYIYIASACGRDVGRAWPEVGHVGMREGALGGTPSPPHAPRLLPN